MKIKTDVHVKDTDTGGRDVHPQSHKATNPEQQLPEARSNIKCFRQHDSTALEQTQQKHRPLSVPDDLRDGDGVLLGRSRL